MSATDPIEAAHAQHAHQVRFDWGPTGARATTSDLGAGDVAVVVDVLSFTTTVTIAAARGARAQVDVDAVVPLLGRDGFRPA